MRHRESRKERTIKAFCGGPTGSPGDAGNEEAGKKLDAAIEAGVNSVTVTFPQQKEPPVEITEAPENAA